jgi:hypothetical protein
MGDTFEGYDRVDMMGREEYTPNPLVDHETCGLASWMCGRSCSYCDHGPHAADCFLRWVYPRHADEVVASVLKYMHV